MSHPTPLLYSFFLHNSKKNRGSDERQRECVRVRDTEVLSCSNQFCNLRENWCLRRSIDFLFVQFIIAQIMAVCFTSVSCAIYLCATVRNMCRIDENLFNHFVVVFHFSLSLALSLLSSSFVHWILVSWLETRVSPKHFIQTRLKPKWTDTSNHII